MQPQDSYIDLPSEKMIVNTNPNATPYERIKEAAEKFNVQVKEPKKNCKHCYGRGYIGINKAHYDEPIPCKCIYPDMNEATKHAYEDRQFVPRNRKEKRAAFKMMRRMK